MDEAGLVGLDTPAAGTASVAESAARARAQRVCTASLLLSVIIMMVGLVWAYRIGMRAVAVSHPLEHVQERVTQMREQVKQAEAKAR